MMVFLIVGIEYAEYREVYVSVKKGNHPILSSFFNRMIEELRVKSGEHSRSSNSKGSSDSETNIALLKDVFNNMIMCKVELKTRIK